MAINNPDEIEIQAIIDIIKLVPGAGKVYDQLPLVKDQAEIIARLVHNGMINTVCFTRIDRKVIKTQGGFALETIEKYYEFAYYRAFNFGSNSDKTVRVFAEDMCNLFNKNLTLNDTVDEHGKMDQVGNKIVAFVDVAVHKLNFTLTTFKSQNNS